MTAVLSPQQSTTCEGRGFPLSLPPQAIYSSALTAYLMETHKIFDERASGIIQFPPKPGPRLSHQLAPPLRIWSHLIYYYRHNDIYYWHQNLPKIY